MKNHRHDVILEIISEHPVATQETLIELLSKRGITATQATVSRDIQQLSLVKQRDENGLYRYTIPQSAVIERTLFEETVYRLTMH